MKTILSFIFWGIYSTNVHVVDQTINSVQTGFFGVWWHNETKITRHWGMHFELDYEAPITDKARGGYDGLEINGITDNNIYPSITPVISLEPHCYYNSSKRQGNSKNTFHNIGNYAAFGLRYYPNIFRISPNPITNNEHSIYIIPTWSLRRNIRYRLNAQLAVFAGVDLLDVFEPVPFGLHRVTYLLMMLF